MSYTQIAVNANRFSILSRTSTATLVPNTTLTWESVSTLGGDLTTTTQPAGSLIIGQLRCATVNSATTAEWQIAGGSFTAKACDQEPNEVSSLTCNTYACSVAGGTTANNIFITNGGSNVDDTLMTDSHAISYS